MPQTKSSANSSGPTALLKKLGKQGSRLKNVGGNLKLLQKLVLTDRVVVLYAVPKFVCLFFLVLCKVVPLKFARRGLALTLTLVEIGLAAWQTRRRYLTGTALVEASRHNLLRLALNLGILGLQFSLFALLVWPVALLLGLVIGLLGLLGQVALNLWLLVVGMRAAPAGETTELFQQIRQMQNLEAAIMQLQTRLAITKERGERYDLRFYLAWAETYLGHQALAGQNWSTAQKHYQEALVADPTNPAACAMLCLALARQDAFPAAVTLYLQLVAQVKGAGAAKKEPILWSRHVNESSSEYEINAGLFQLGALLYVLVGQGQPPAPKAEGLNIGAGAIASNPLQEQILEGVALLPNRSAEELLALLAKKAGGSLGALNVLAAGPYRAPANPLEYLTELTGLPKTTAPTTPSNETAA